jgi:phenylacetate-CoA ligase
LGQLNAHQFAQLGRLLAPSARTMPFWRERLGTAGIRPGEALTPEAWERIPVLTRASAQDAGRAVHCRSVPAAHGPVSRKATSGSTGQPLILLKTALQQTFWDAFNLRRLLWHGVDRRRKLAVIVRGELEAMGSANGWREPVWWPAIDKVFPTGPLVGLDIRHPIAEQAAWLIREDPDYLIGWPRDRDTAAQLRDAADPL